MISYILQTLTKAINSADLLHWINTWLADGQTIQINKYIKIT